MPVTTRRRRGLLAGVLTATVAAIITVAPAAARPSPAGALYTIAQLRTGCITIGGTAAGRPIKVVQRRQGTKIATFSQIAPAGQLVTCTLKPIRTADVLAVSETVGAVTTTRRITVPDLSIDVDAATDTLRMSFPEAGVNVGFEVLPLVAGFFAPGGSLSNGITDVDGNLDWTPGLAFTSAFGRATYGSALEQFSLVDGTPSVTVVAGSATVRGTGDYGSAVTIRLTSSTGTRKATATAFIEAGVEPRFTAILRNAQGAKVKAAPGDRISVSTIPGKRFTVRPSSLQVDPEDGDGWSLSATCAAGETYVVVLDGAALDASDLGPDTAITFGTTSGPLPAGSKVQVGCENPSGLGQVMTVVTT